MANLMLNHPSYCYYNPVVGLQNTSDESDEATSHPIGRVPSRVGAAAGREIVDVDTLEQKVVDDNTAFIVGGLVVEKVRNDVPFYYLGCGYCKKRMIVNDQGNLRCERHACVNGNTYFVVRVCFVESATGRYMVDLIRPVYGRSVRSRCKRPFSYARKHADVQVEHFGRDTCVSHH
ncbi:hypothetical protein NP493_590g01003 [Ridgeia piscesae]|uniref:Uncharacterized protein n=1 Tax=Ridgeia piscesae TaxID=27915 RepID=A0AAD9KUD2_RIDPI|nr:hypothetical protein NP493_590g01003 [Ridgeia piscesae]